jgi:hypothetical protein
MFLYGKSKAATYTHMYRHSVQLEHVMHKHTHTYIDCVDIVWSFLTLEHVMQKHTHTYIDIVCS